MVAPRVRCHMVPHKPNIQHCYILIVLKVEFVINPMDTELKYQIKLFAVRVKYFTTYWNII